MNGVNKPSPTLLIDGSSLAFLHANKEDYKESIRSHMRNLLTRWETNKFNIILEDSKRNFRINEAKSKEYKGHRRTDKAKQNQIDYLPYLGDCFKEINKTYKPLCYWNVENDDIIGILSQRINCVICANDVDMLAVPGIHFNLKSNKTTYVSYPGTIELVDGKIKATGLFQCYAQVIKGSQKENYGGLKGYGDKGTYEALRECKTETDMQNVCATLFESTYKNEWRTKLREGFRLSWVIIENDTLFTPRPIEWGELTFT
jgi:hypothetical protein